MSIIEFPSRINLISFRTQRGLARKARRDARRIIRDFNRLRKLGRKEEEAFKTGRISKLTLSLEKTASTLRDELKRALDILRQEDVLRLREINNLAQSLRLLRGNPEQAKTLGGEIRVLKDFFGRQVTMLDRLRRGEKGVVVQGLGTDQAAIVKTLKSGALIEKRSIRARQRQEKSLSRSVKAKKDLASEVRNLASCFRDEEKRINEVITDDVIEIYYLLKRIDLEEANIRHYMSKGFPKLVGEKLLKEFEDLKKDFFSRANECYQEAQNLLNLVSRQAA